jgi:hypothetical protein
MEQGKKRVKVIEYLWNWRYVGKLQKLHYVIVGVKWFIVDGKNVEPSPPPSIGKWDAHCDLVEDAEFPIYECSEDFINELVESSK